MRILLTGWFSFRDGEATAGDLLALDVAQEWLEEADIEHDVAYSPVFGSGVELDRADPEDYSDVVFVCGPASGRPIDELRARFRRSRFTFLDVSMLHIDDGPSDLVFERDSERLVRPDLAIAADTVPAPRIAVVRSHAQPEYGERDGHRKADHAIDRLLERHRLATYEVDTRVDPRHTEARDARQIEGLIAGADTVVTSRLHGLVLAIKHGVPALVLDPVDGGGKVMAQARALDWPETHMAARVSDEALDRSLAKCLHPSSRGQAGRCRERAIAEVDALGVQFLAALTGSESSGVTPRTPFGDASGRRPG